ncbi:MAG: hypothetical protein R3D32_02155 [Nitratireductor sp.]
MPTISMLQDMSARAAAMVATLTLAASLALTASAEAQQRSYSRTASSGKAQWIDAYYGWNNDCSFKTIDVDVIDGPAHGKASPRVETRKITQAQVGSTGSCLGKPTKAVAVYYTSKRGYRGQDRFRVRMKVGGQQPVVFSYSITVR